MSNGRECGDFNGMYWPNNATRDLLEKLKRKNEKTIQPLSQRPMRFSPERGKVKVKAEAEHVKS